MVIFLCATVSTVYVMAPAFVFKYLNVHSEALNGTLFYVYF